MTVRIDSCYRYFRLMWHDRYGRPYVEYVSNPEGDWWDRDFASQAKDKVQLCCPDVKRDSIRWHYGRGV